MLPSGRPPQFVVVSFDGAGNLARLARWRSVARETGARFTYFLSGVYLLDPAHADVYVGPGHRPGASSIGFAPWHGTPSPEVYLRDLVAMLQGAEREGDEVGTHYNGHFCAGVVHPVGTWSAADWTDELDRFDQLAAGIALNNGFARPVPNPLGPDGVIGGRTPCLEGDMDVLYPVLAQRGFRYDASRAGVAQQWPQRVDGIWSFTLDRIPLAGLPGRTNLSMDYNLYVAYAGAHEVPPEREAWIRDQAFRTLDGYFEASYRGGRAPVKVGNHLNGWNHDAYSGALERFVRTECTKPEVRCVSFADLARWLDARTPAQLAVLQAAPAG